MEKPKMNLSYVFESDYVGGIKKVVLRAFYKLPHEYEDDRAYDCNYNLDRYFNNLFWHAYQPKFEIKPIEEYNLDDIIKLIPEGLTPADIKMKTQVESGDMGIYGFVVVFYYEKYFAPNMDEYNRLRKEYDIALDEYEKLEKEYENYLINEKIKELKERLR